MRALHALLLITLPALAFGIPVAQAALPAFKDTKIVPGTSIAGVKMGASPDAAKKAWGKSGGLCGITAGTGTCFFRPKGVTQSNKGEGIVDFKSGKVVNVSVSAPLASGGGRSFKTPFTKLKTSKGVGIGSTVAHSKKAYPKVKISGNYATIKGKGGMQTIFTSDSPSNRIFTVQIQLVSGD